MNTIFKCAVMFLSMLALPGHAQAASAETPASTASSEPGVVGKVERAVVRGAKAAASGVQRGARAAASGIQRGAKATARGVEHGAKATASAAGRVAAKVGSAPASAPPAGK